MAENPLPEPVDGAAETWSRYRRLMVWMALASAAAALLSILYLKLAMGFVPIGMMIATIAGVGLSVLLAAALMGLVFASNRGGHDDAASRHEEDRP